jgi:hypothetical protein
MAATHECAAILRDARIGDARAPPIRAPQDEVADRFSRFEEPRFSRGVSNDEASRRLLGKLLFHQNLRHIIA